MEVKGVREVKGGHHGLTSVTSFASLTSLTSLTSFTHLATASPDDQAPDSRLTDS